MNQCRECGARLAEDSRFCLQCGTENKTSDSRSSVPEKDLDFLRPAITGGLALGVLSSIPIIGALNVVCCLWAHVGGGLAAWLLNNQRPGGLKYSDGAFGGVFSGLIGAIVATVINVPVQMLVMTPERVADMEQSLRQMPFSPEFRDMMLRFLQPGFDLSRTLFLLLMYMILFGLFAMIGGIITAAVLSRRKLD
jgi:hypothetical protein